MTTSDREVVAALTDAIRRRIGEPRYNLWFDRHTRFTWEEELTFPWWLGAGAGGIAAGPVLRRVWRRSLRNLRSLVETSRAVSAAGGRLGGG